MEDDELRTIIEAAFRAGFNISEEGFNAEHMYNEDTQKYEDKVYEYVSKVVSELPLSDQDGDLEHGTD